MYLRIVRTKNSLSDTDTTPYITQASIAVTKWIIAMITAVQVREVLQLIRY